MANIPLSQIPNAPQEVFTPVADPKFTGDIVGDQAKSEIRQGYAGMMVDPAKAGAAGRGLEALGQGITQGSEGAYRGYMLSENADRRKEYQDAQATGLTKYYQNATQIQKAYQDVMLDKSPDQGPSTWIEVAGKNGENFYEGMTPMERTVTTHEALNSFFGGLRESSNRGYNYKLAEKAMNADFVLSDLANNSKWDDYDKVSESSYASGTIGGTQYKSNIIRSTVGRQYDELKAKCADPDFRKDIQTAFDQGQRLENYPNLGTKEIKNALNIGRTIEDQSNWNVATGLMSMQDSGAVTTNAQYELMPAFKALPDDIKKTITDRLLNNRAGTPAADLAFSDSLQKVGEFPKKDSHNVSSEALELRKYIAREVSPNDQKPLFAEIDKKMGELVKNKGRLNPDTIVSQYLNKAGGAYLNEGIFGKYSPDALTGKTKEEDVQASLKALKTWEAIKDRVLQTNPQNVMDVDNALDKETRNLRAAQQSQQAATPQKSSWWSRW